MTNWPTRKMLRVGSSSQASPALRFGTIWNLVPNFESLKKMPKMVRKMRKNAGKIAENHGKSGKITEIRENGGQGMAKESDEK